MESGVARVKSIINMADNYLERRMEELRSGQLSVKSRIPGIKPGSKRVVVAGGTAGKARDEVLSYRKQGCRVAVFDSDEDAGRKMAYEHGVRFHHVNLEDIDSVSREMDSLLRSWRNVDVIVGDEYTCIFLERKVKEWRSSLPIPDISDLNIVIIENSTWL